MSARDRQVLAAAYLPVIAFATVLVAARISRTRRHQLQASSEMTQNLILSALSAAGVSLSSQLLAAYATSAGTAANTRGTAR
jgi:hypothetical protein